MKYHGYEVTRGATVADFRFLAKHLLYCTSTIELPIGESYDKSMESALKEQRKIDMRLWCFPTPEQKMALTKSHVLFLSTFGTGKTLLMTAKACELAKQGEKVTCCTLSSTRVNQLKLKLCCTSKRLWNLRNFHMLITSQ